MKRDLGIDPSKDGSKAVSGFCLDPKLNQLTAKRRLSDDLGNVSTI